MTKNSLKLISFFAIITFLFSSCEEKIYTPKPRGYYRITFPEKKYQKLDSIFPYTFEYPVYSKITRDKGEEDEPNWINITFPKLNAKIYISYKDISNNFAEFEEDTRKLAYKHTIKADAINEKVWENKEAKVYGILYRIKGDAASGIQFYLTDSVKHFIRASLYFNNHPNKDSLAPSLKFISDDINYMIKSFRWKNK